MSQPAGPVVYLFAAETLAAGGLGANAFAAVDSALQRGRNGRRGAVRSIARAGDTALSLLPRLELALRGTQPHWVVLAVGSNDVWLRWLSRRGLAGWLRVQAHALRTGQRPAADLDRFAAAYRALVDTAQSAAAGQVLACTVGPLGEALTSPLNAEVARLNGVIRRVAVECQVALADVWQGFAEVLAPQPRRKAGVPDAWWSAARDRRLLRSRTIDELSQQRRLLLTFDGIHLNSRGDSLLAETIVGALDRAGAR